MDRFRKTLAFALILCFLAPAFPVTLHAVNLTELQRSLGFIPPVPPQPPPPPDPAYQYVYVQGGEFYADFAGLPDFKHFARTAPQHVVEYPSTNRGFYYLGYSNVEFTYRTKIIDYITGDTGAVRRYKTTLTELGFRSLTELKSANFQEYFDEVALGLILDPDFILDPDGIFVIEVQETFRLLLIGRSVTVDRYGVMHGCVELRFYSLTRSAPDPLDLVSVRGTLSNSPFEQNSGIPGNSSTPAAAANNSALFGVSPGSLPTPNAINDVRSITGVTTVFHTPDALGDIRALPAENVTYLFTPEVIIR